MNQRYQATLANDRDLMLTISLTNVLIIKVKILAKPFNHIFKLKQFKDPVATQWTNTTLCKVVGNPTYGLRVPLLGNCSMITFATYMNQIAPSLPFVFDHAVAIIPPEYYRSHKIFS